jgi:hypothetical protein
MTAAQQQGASGRADERGNRPRKAAAEVEAPPSEERRGNAARPHAAAFPATQRPDPPGRCGSCRPVQEAVPSATTVKQRMLLHDHIGATAHILHPLPRVGGQVAVGWIEQNASLLQALASLASVAVAVAALTAALAASRREQRIARLAVRFRRDTRGGYLVLINSGPHSATIESVSVEPEDLLPDEGWETLLPVKSLAPRSDYHLPLARGFQEKPAHVTLAWRDGRWRPQKETYTVSLREPSYTDPRQLMHELRMQAAAHR